MKNLVEQAFCRPFSGDIENIKTNLLGSYERGRVRRYLIQFEDIIGNQFCQEISRFSWPLILFRQRPDNTNTSLS